jgi:hypothetical protein
MPPHPSHQILLMYRVVALPTLSLPHHLGEASIPFGEAKKKKKK